MMIDHELHRRKTFWVDEALAYMLDQTDLDVAGGELRVPFPAFALVFTDRHVLSLGERLLANSRDTPLAGHLLRVATVHVTEHNRGEHQRVLGVCFAFDALGGDLPALVRHEIVVAVQVLVPGLSHLSTSLVGCACRNDTFPCGSSTVDRCWSPLVAIAVRQQAKDQGHEEQAREGATSPRDDD